MQSIQAIIQRAQSNLKTIVLPEGQDSRILKAASQCHREGIARPIVLGDPREIHAQANKESIDIEGIEIIDPRTADKLPTFVDQLHDLRQHKGMTKAEAQEALKDPLVYANCLLRAGDVDGCVAGIVTTSAHVLRTAFQIVGVQPDCNLVSSFFLLAFPEGPLESAVFSDCALIIEPNAGELATIAVNAADGAKELLGMDPRVALLSFSSAGSGKHERVEKVAAATAQAQQQRPQYEIVGEIQFDAALSPAVFAQKCPEWTLSGPANVFIFPNLESANIGYKIAERLTNAASVGPIMQGLNRPINDLSRGANVDAIVNTIAMTAIQAAGNN